MRGIIAAGIALLFVPAPARADTIAAPLVAEITAGPRAMSAGASVTESGPEGFNGSYMFSVGEQLAPGGWTMVGRLAARRATVSGRSARGGGSLAPAGADDLAAGAVLASAARREPGVLYRAGVVASGNISFAGVVRSAALEMTLFQ